MRDHDYWVYILTNKHRTTLDIGMTNDIECRLWEHGWGETPGFARRYHLNRLVWFERFRDVNDAIACEKTLKGWLRKRKIELIEKTNPHWLDLSEEWEQEPNVRTLGIQKKWSEILRSAQNDNCFSGVMLSVAKHL